jgi:hypothetical protein
MPIAWAAACVAKVLEIKPLEIKALEIRPRMSQS